MSAPTDTPAEATGTDEDRGPGEVGGPEAADLLDVVVDALGGQRREGQATDGAGRHRRDPHPAAPARAGRHRDRQVDGLPRPGRRARRAHRPRGGRHDRHAGPAGPGRRARPAPRSRAAIAPQLHREPTWELLKGRSNYLCRNKLDGGFPSRRGRAVRRRRAHRARPAADADGRLGREVVRLREWAETTTSGDRDELDPGVSDRAWRQVSVSARECLGAQRCPVAAECFSERVRARARTVDVVVTNHAMTAIDALESSGQLLPEHDVARRRRGPRARRPRDGGRHGGAVRRGAARRLSPAAAFRGHRVRAPRRRGRRPGGRAGGRAAGPPGPLAGPARRRRRRPSATPPAPP